MAPDETERQIFISWSGEHSRRIALALKAWLEGVVFESLRVWVSDADIDLGARAIPSIEANLNRSIGGILVLTVENQSSPWINFEAGALSRQFQDEPRRVIPLLVDATSMGQLSAPLNIFQGQIFNRQGMQRVLEALYEVQGLDAARAATRMDAYWPDLEDSLTAIVDDLKTRPAQETEPDPRAIQAQLHRVERILIELSSGHSPLPRTSRRQTSSRVYAPPWSQQLSLSHPAGSDEQKRALNELSKDQLEELTALLIVEFLRRDGILCSGVQFQPSRTIMYVDAIPSPEQQARAMERELHERGVPAEFVVINQEGDS